MIDPFLGAELGADVPEIDLHGMSSSEADVAIEGLVQNAFMRTDRVIRIIHGRGAGILKETARKKLSGHPNIRSFRTGDGVTFAEIEKRNR